MPVIYFVSLANGRILWEWSDFYIKPEYVFVDDIFISNNILLISNRSNNYAINLESGKTVWRTTDNRSGRNGATGIGNLYFFPAFNNQLFYGDITRGNERKLLTLNDSIQKHPVTVQAPTPSIFNSDTLLIMAYSSALNAAPFTMSTFLLLYNFTQQTIVYNLLQRQGFTTQENLSPYGLPIVVNDRIYSTIGKTIQCNELLTGKLVWRSQDLGSTFAFSGITLNDGRIIGNSDGGTLYSLDYNTGQISWKESTSSAAGKPFCMNGTIYVIGLGDGLLHAVDAQTGQHIWKLKSPDDASSNGASFFTGSVTGDGKYIYIRTFLNLYCYKAAR